MRIRMLPAVVSGLVAGCGGVVALGGGGEADMAYTVPEGELLRYQRTDSMGITVQAPGFGSFDMRVDQEMTLGLDFAPWPGGVRVTATVERLAARMTNPVMGPVTLSEADVRGDLVLTADSRGRTELVGVPEVSGAGGPLFNPSSLGYDLLPRLPPAGTRPGETWADTIRYDTDRDATGSVGVTWTGTSTLVGDTVVNGKRLRLVRTRADVTIHAVGAVARMEATQNMRGPETGFYLWDPIRRAMVEQQIERELSGTVEVPAVPAPMRLTAEQRKTMKMIGR